MDRGVFHFWFRLNKIVLEKGHKMIVVVVVVVVVVVLLLLSLSSLFCFFFFFYKSSSICDTNIGVRADLGP